jgi:hypothetical protein
MDGEKIYAMSVEGAAFASMVCEEPVAKNAEEVASVCTGGTDLNAKNAKAAAFAIMDARERIAENAEAEASVHMDNQSVIAERATISPVRSNPVLFKATDLQVFVLSRGTCKGAMETIPRL